MSKAWPTDIPVPLYIGSLRFPDNHDLSCVVSVGENIYYTPPSRTFAGISTVNEVSAAVVLNAADRTVIDKDGFVGPLCAWVRYNRQQPRDLRTKDLARDLNVLDNVAVLRRGQLVAIAPLFCNVECPIDQARNDNDEKMALYKARYTWRASPDTKGAAFEEYNLVQPPPATDVTARRNAAIGTYIETCTRLKAMVHRQLKNGTCPKLDDFHRQEIGKRLQALEKSGAKITAAIIANTGAIIVKGMSVGPAGAFAEKAQQPTKDKKMVPAGSSSKAASSKATSSKAASSKATSSKAVPASSSGKAAPASSSSKATSSKEPPRAVQSNPDATVSSGTKRKQNPVDTSPSQKTCPLCLKSASHFAEVWLTNKRIVDASCSTISICETCAVVCMPQENFCDALLDLESPEDCPDKIYRLVNLVFAKHLATLPPDEEEVGKVPNHPLCVVDHLIGLQVPGGYQNREGVFGNYSIGYARELTRTETAKYTLEIAKLEAKLAKTEQALGPTVKRKK